jgi:ferredoxin
MDRFEIARSIFERRAFFKLVCGAGNENPVEIRRLATVYTLAGVSGIDLSANPSIIRSALEGISRAEELAHQLGRPDVSRPFITVSVGLEGDPHIRKAEINRDSCIRCGRCEEVCKQDAVEGAFTIIQERCIGCGRCEEVCEEGAISFLTKKIELQELIPDCLRAGAEMVELHAVTLDDNGVMSDWDQINSLAPDNFISMCLDRSLLSDRHLIQRIHDAYAIAGDRMIVQADGAPMSGGSDDYRTTLQAIATADIVSKSRIPVWILASGGTNSKTRALADLCGVVVHGVSIGTFARKLVKPYLLSDKSDQDIAALQDAVTAAENLIRVTTSPNRKH